MPLARSRRCLGPELSAYADRTLSPAELVLWDRHLVACAGCRGAVAAERRMLASLRAAGGPQVPSGLRASLLSLGHPGDGVEMMSSGQAGRPTAASVGISALPVPVVDRRAPALHRSPVRATVFAGLAAGASAAAAWSFAVTGAPLPAPNPASVPPAPAVQRARPASSFVSTSFVARTRVSGSLAGSLTRPARTVVVPTRAPVVSGSPARWAESTP